MKILAIADIADLRWQHGTGKADVLLSCGDVVEPVIIEAAQAYGCDAILAVKGNHDLPTPFSPPIVDLHCRLYEHRGISFGGLNGSWKYKPRGHFLYKQKEVEEMLAAFPRVDIFLSHNSPQGVHDKADGIHHGFSGLSTYIAGAQPGVVTHGHQHLDKTTKRNRTQIVGVYQHKIIEIQEHS